MTDTGNNFERSLQQLLAKLHKTAWADPLKELEKKMRQIPETDDSFGVEIINMLHQLGEALTLDAATPIPQLAAIRLAAFNCWTYRFFNEASDGRQYLDPLTATASEFTCHISIQQSSSPFPAPDIIKRWAREHLQ
jgi:hypothetical protein